jgi:glycosyltransferase involved in cell wall biosynthesis
MPSPSYRPRLIFSVTNCICHDQRVMKIAETVSMLNCDITIIGRKKGNCCNLTKIPYETKRFKMLFKKGFLFYKFFNIRLFIFLLFHKNDILVSNDLDTLLSNFLVSKIKRTPLVYDSHEYFTEMPEVQNRPFVKWFWTKIEKSIFPKLKYVMTVSEPIALRYENLYHIKPLVVRNISKNTTHIIPFKREELNLRQNDLLVILQGTGINIDKGAEELIDAVNSTDGVVLLIIGSGDLISELKRRVGKLKIGEKVRFIPVLQWEELMKYTKTADAGMCLEKDTNLNYRYSLPNKLFDYISAGIPVIANDLPESGKIIKENNCGIIISSVTPENISFALSELRDNPVRLAELKRNAVATSAKLNWEIESEKVKDFYNKILFSVIFIIGNVLIF